MEFIRITNSDTEEYKKAMELYSISFPLHEQRKSNSQLKIMDDPNYYFNIILDNKKFVGIILCWKKDNFIYVEHLCISPKMRNRKYGQRALELLSSEQKVIILEIDPPIDDISIRRLSFYERCGFFKNIYSHIHPPYREENKGHNLVIMSYPKKITDKEYAIFNDYLKNHIMSDVF